MKMTFTEFKNIQFASLILLLLISLGCRSSHVAKTSVIKQKSTTRDQLQTDNDFEAWLDEVFKLEEIPLNQPNRAGTLPDENFEAWLAETFGEKATANRVLASGKPQQTIQPKKKPAKTKNHTASLEPKPTTKHTPQPKPTPEPSQQSQTVPPKKTKVKKERKKTKTSPKKKSVKKKATQRSTTRKKRKEKPKKEKSKKEKIAKKTKILPSQKESIEPKLRPGLLLDIQVSALRQIEVDAKSVRIDSAGLVNLPILGSVNTESMTLSQFTDHLTTRYSEYLRNTRVEIKFVFDQTDAATSPWGYVTVLGQVNQAGRVTLPASGQMTVSMAIQQAGGFDTSAKKKAIIVTRKKGEKTTEIKVNLKTLGKKGNADHDISLFPGDQVYVPEYFF